MTVTYPIAGSFSIGAGEPFTVDDLFALPDDGNRYEIFDGSLVLTPPPALRHIRVTAVLRDLLLSAKPAGCQVVENIGIFATDRDYYIPDLVVLRKSALERGDDRGIRPDEVLLAVEVVSPGSPSKDHVWKRHTYARFGIKHYWIADPRDKTLLRLELGDDASYVESAGNLFGVRIDPSEVF